MMLVTYASADGYMDSLPNLLRGWRGEVFCEILPADWSWTRACSYKPELIQKAARMYSGILVYLDADAEIRTAFAERDVEEALGEQTWGVRWVDPWWATGTILVDTRHATVWEWLKVWRSACERDPDRHMADQAHLTDMAAEWPHAALDPAWCWIEPTSPAKAVPPPDPVYIWHMQASRRFAAAKGGHGRE